MAPPDGPGDHDEVAELLALADELYSLPLAAFTPARDAR